MTVTAQHLPQHHSPVRAGAIERDRDARRRVEATRRRQEALARLAQRRMPLPGSPLPGLPADGHRTPGVGEAMTRRDGDMTGRAHMMLVTSAGQCGAEIRRCNCGESSSDVADRDRPSLTTREVQVLRTWLMVDSKPAVAEELFISLGTVNTHLTRIRAKYAEIGRAAPTKAALVARAVQDGLISLDEL